MYATPWLALAGVAAVTLLVTLLVTTRHARRAQALRPGELVR